MSRHISRNEKWKRTDQKEEYVSDFGVVVKSQDGKTWVALVKEGFGLRVCGKNFRRARNAMIAVEEAAKQLERKGLPLPPIYLHANIFS